MGIISKIFVEVAKEAGAAVGIGVLGKAVDAIDNLEEWSEKRAEIKESKAEEKRKQQAQREEENMSKFQIAMEKRKNKFTHLWMGENIDVGGYNKSNYYSFYRPDGTLVFNTRNVGERNLDHFLLLAPDNLIMGQIIERLNEYNNPFIAKSKVGSFSMEALIGDNSLGIISNNVWQAKQLLVAEFSKWYINNERKGEYEILNAEKDYIAEVKTKTFGDNTVSSLIYKNPKHEVLVSLIAIAIREYEKKKS